MMSNLKWDRVTYRDEQLKIGWGDLYRVNNLNEDEQCKIPS